MMCYHVKEAGQWVGVFGLLIHDYTLNGVLITECYQLMQGMIYSYGDQSAARQCPGIYVVTRYMLSQLYTRSCDHDASSLLSTHEPAVDVISGGLTGKVWALAVFNLHEHGLLNQVCSSTSCETFLGCSYQRVFLSAISEIYGSRLPLNFISY